MAAGATESAAWAAVARHVAVLGIWAAEAPWQLNLYTSRLMSTAQYLTAPVPSRELPKGIPYIVGNEAAERFSFYGMKTILVVFMSQYLMSSQAAPAYMTETQSREWMHWFVASAYFTPIFGAILADAVLGKYRTILLLSLVYCAGHLA
ncbi:MAG TPA: hypothetical protein DCR70_01865, partial [Phycisphaerales bacterium]|nr:hypothetical protein [Phycisphaerales bacterium]